MNLVTELNEAADKWWDLENLSKLLRVAAMAITMLEEEVKLAESLAQGIDITLNSVIEERDALARVILEMIRDQESKKPRRKQKKGISPSWKVTDELLDWVKSTFPDLDGENEAEGFREYWLASGDPKLNWDMAFRTWCRNADKWARDKRGRSGSQANARADQINDGNRQRIRNLLGELDEG